MATGGAGSGPPSIGAFAVRYAPHDPVVQCSAEYWLERLGGYSQKQTASMVARRSQTAPTSTKLRGGSKAAALSDQPGQRTRRVRTHSARHSAGAIGQPSRFDCRLHRARHQHGVFGVRDRRVQQHRIAA
jgi:hypothetical protein